MQFRAEFFNAFNHPQFTNPNAGQGAILQPSGQGIGFVWTDYVHQREPTSNPIRAEIHFLRCSASRAYIESGLTAMSVEG